MPTVFNKDVVQNIVDIIATIQEGKNPTDSDDEVEEEVKLVANW
jgi:hypothetical protein